MNVKSKVFCDLSKGMSVPFFVDSNGDTLYLLGGFSVSSDDYGSISFWSHYESKVGYFSSNIEIVALTSAVFGCGMLVKKKNPSLTETIEFEIDNVVKKITF